MMIGGIGDLETGAMVRPMEGCPAGMTEIPQAGICVPAVPTRTRTRAGWERRGISGAVCVSQIWMPNEETGIQEPVCVRWSEPMGPAGPITPGQAPSPVPVYRAEAVGTPCRKGTLGDQLCTDAEVKRGVSDEYLTYGALILAAVGLYLLIRK